MPLVIISVHCIIMIMMVKSKRKLSAENASRARWHTQGGNKNTYGNVVNYCTT